MMGCRKIRGLIAASAYEELAEAERRALDRHLAACEACRAESEMLARVAAKIPKGTPELGIDLGPRLRARLAEEREARTAPRWGWGKLYAYGAVAAVVALLFAFQAGLVQVGPNGVSVASGLSKDIDEARTLLAAHDYSGAYELLSRGVVEHPEAAGAADAQMMLANLAFERRWYDRADQAYQALMTRYSDAVQLVPAADRAVILERWNMLDEGRKTKYALLQELDRARSDGGFEAYENVVAQAPTSYAAQTAVREMVAMAGAPGSPQDVVTAMQSVRAQCRNPIAVAKLDLEIGLTAWRDLRDVGLARDSLRKVESGGEPVLAQRAREALSEIAAVNPS
ncbi:MAG: zf-HC2 domain-containing protein [FCB group bacterium]|jgi:predicted anti-sigma-YlaC factor YlaD|nr:zf-HC2 domain-containing protein [FCB group bacterium]